MKKIRHLLQGSAFFTLASSIESLAPFILAPLLTRYLTVFDYGIWAIFQGAVAFLRPVMGLSLDDYLRIHFLRHEKHEHTNTVITITWLSLCIAVITCLLFVIFHNEAAALLKFPDSWLWSIALCAWLFAIFYMLLTYHQFAGNYKYYAAIHAVQTLGTLLATAAFILGGLGWVGAVLGKIVGLVCGCVSAMFLLFRNNKEYRISQYISGNVMNLVRFGIHYLPNGMLVVVMLLLDRLMLAHMQSVEASSLYAVASLFPMMLFIAIQGFLFGWQPWCFHRLQTPSRQHLKELAIGFLVYVFLLPVGAIALNIICIWFGPLLIGDTFHEAFDYVPMLLAAMVLQGGMMLAQSILQYYQKLSILSVLATGAIILNIALNYILINSSGIAGAALAKTLTYGIIFTLTLGIAVFFIYKFNQLNLKGTTHA